MSGVEPITSSLFPRVWRTWRGRLDSKFLLGFGYALAALLTAISIYFSSRAPESGPIGPASRTIIIVAAANLVLILALAAQVGWSVVSLIADQSRDAAAKLHLRFVGMFALAAFVPAIVVAVFFGALVTRGVENWFSKRVQTVVENSTTVARSYVNEQTRTIYGDLLAMATDLGHAAPLFRTNPVSYGRILEGQAAARYFPGAYVVDHEGRILASAELDTAPPFVAPPPGTFRSADEGVVEVKTFESADLIRALYKMKGYDDAYLYVVRRAEPGIFNNLSAASGALQAYRDAAAHRHQIQAAFLLTYIETVLLVLVGAVWLGMAAAKAISAPVARLVAAAHKVSEGDLTARVVSHNDPEALAVLAQAFNKMTGDLQAQQQALKAASLEAQSRRQFIETVLAGVSAGVLGLDAEGRISAANQQAHALLGLGEEPLGRTLAQVAPELAGVAAAAARSGGEAEEEIDVMRAGETRRLRVRASRAADGGLVLTFDDITRLVTAQRSAAWRDVARRIAHEIKNPLTPIQLSAERLRRKYRSEIKSDLETFDRCTDTIVRQVGDIGRMVDEFSAFARMPAPRFGAHSASELLRQAVFAQRVANPDLVIDLHEADEDIPLVCDDRMVGQALTNVLKNAGEAIAARRQGEPGVKGHIVASLRADRRGVCFEVEDNGVGLPSNRERLTEPYVTTREKGTGLGLAIVKRILEEHGGELQLLDAAQTPGARAVLRFPDIQAAEHPAPAGASVA
ncbi:MAG: PAS domain-containing sensor histidine kinase, partial [Caulobacteraceae bacterium]